MAIDTRDKRASVIGYGLPFGVLPDVDATIDQGNRQHLVGLYPGILAEAAAIASYVRVAISDQVAYGAVVSDARRYGVTASDAERYGVEVGDN